MEKFYFAPLEGISGYVYRKAYEHYFGGIDKYFIPFIKPNQKGKLSSDIMYIAEALEKLDPFGFQTEIRRKLTEKPGHSHGMLMDFRISSKECIEDYI